MVTGTATGFTINLELQGTGFRASTTAKELTLNLGYSNPRVLPIPAGVKVAVEKGTNLSISGPDKQVVGQFCAIIRAQRSPDPYLGKGVRFAGEVIKLKEGKAAGKK